MSDNQQTNQILEDNSPTEQQSTQQQPTESTKQHQNGHRRKTEEIRWK